MTAWPNVWPSWRNSASQRWNGSEPWERRTPACMNKLPGSNSNWPPPARTPRPPPSRHRATSSSRTCRQPKAARSERRADNSDTSNTCGRRSRPRRSIISSPTRSIAARTAAAGWSFRGTNPKCSSRWKSRKRRRWLPNIEAWLTGARTATRSTTRRRHRRSARGGVGGRFSEGAGGGERAGDQVGHHLRGRTRSTPGTWRSGSARTGKRTSVSSRRRASRATNNLAEQAIRFVVIDRHITQGTRSEKGRRWCERIWTVMATCAQQGRAVFQFLARLGTSASLPYSPALVTAVRPLTASQVFSYSVVFCGRLTVPRERLPDGFPLPRARGATW